MRKALSEKALATLKPAAKRYDVRDLHLPGFGVRVSPSGQKSLFVAFRYGTEQRRMALGRYPLVSLAEARGKAMEALRRLSEGADPTKARRVRSFLLCNVLEEFVEKYAKPKTRGWKPARALLHRELVVPFGQKDIRHVSRADLNGVMDDMIARGAKAQANRFLA